MSTRESHPTMMRIWKGPPHPKKARFCYQHCALSRSSKSLDYRSFVQLGVIVEGCAHIGWPDLLSFTQKGKGRGGQLVKTPHVTHVLARSVFLGVLSSGTRGREAWLRQTIKVMLRLGAIKLLHFSKHYPGQDIIKSWRPISRLNVMYKIGSSCQNTQEVKNERFFNID